MFKFFRKARVNHQVIVLVYSNGRKFEGPKGLTFEGQKRAIQIKRPISFDMLKKIIASKLKLQPHQIISSLTYRFPTSQSTYTDLEILDSEDVECMISAAEKYSDAKVLELYVEIGSSSIPTHLVQPIAAVVNGPSDADKIALLFKSDDDEDRSSKDEIGGGVPNNESPDTEVSEDLNANSNVVGLASSIVIGENNPQQAAGEDDSFSPPSSSTPQSQSQPQPQPQIWKYHVFLNFRGEDTRMGFTDHLYASLERKGIITYRDDKYLGGGEIISAGLLIAIEESMIAITIISRHYAHSSWCLEELQKIVQCKHRQGQFVVPIFYDVEPSDVRHQRNSFEQAFMKHEDRFGPDSEKVLRWRAALSEVTSYSGFSSRDQPEAIFVDRITDYIHKLVMRRLPSCTENLASRMEEVIRQLDIGLKDVRFAYMGHGWHK